MGGIRSLLSAVDVINNLARSLTLKDYRERRLLLWDKMELGLILLLRRVDVISSLTRIKKQYIRFQQDLISNLSYSIQV